jgi:26S proteasome regulatory subunit (ATPase 3-interacting protein)
MGLLGNPSVLSSSSLTRTGTNKRQDAADIASPEELLAMDAQITALKESLPVLKANHKSITTKLNTLRSAPTTVDLAAMVQKLRDENQKKREKLQGFKDGSVKMVTKEELDRTEKELRYWGAKSKARKDGFRNLEAQLLEGMTREEIWEKAGIEEDTM